MGLDVEKLPPTSSRFYLGFFILEFFWLKEWTGVQRAKQKPLTEVGMNNTEAIVEKAELKNTWDAHEPATACSTFRLPGALHWYIDLRGP